MVEVRVVTGWNRVRFVMVNNSVSIIISSGLQLAGLWVGPGRILRASIMSAAMDHVFSISAPAGSGPLTPNCMGRWETMTSVVDGRGSVASELHLGLVRDVHRCRSLSFLTMIWAVLSMQALLSIDALCK